MGRIKGCLEARTKNDAMQREEKDTHSLWSVNLNKPGGAVELGQFVCSLIYKDLWLFLAVFFGLLVWCKGLFLIMGGLNGLRSVAWD